MQKFDDEPSMEFDNINTAYNSIRNEFNGRVESKSYLGRTKRVAWTGNRRFRTI